MSRSAKATRAVQYALQMGVIEKAACFVCGNPIVEAHHVAYDKPLVVVWLCSAHHIQLHSEISSDWGRVSAFGRRLQEARGRIGLTQTAFGSSIGATKQAVSSWELGRTEPSIETMRAICKKLDVSADWLIGSHFNPEPQ